MYCKKASTCVRDRSQPKLPQEPYAPGPARDSLCFLVEKDAQSNKMPADVLRQNAVPFLTDGRMGAGLATYAGPRLESSRFYVRFDDLDRANTIVDELFGEESPR
jgi:hypothetical protein